MLSIKNWHMSCFACLWVHHHVVGDGLPHHLHFLEVSGATVHSVIDFFPGRNVNVKRCLINYPHLSDNGQIIFCLSFPSRDRATAPGRYEQFYFTEHVPYPLRGCNQIRLVDPVQLFCNSFYVQHKMVGDDYLFILQCLVYLKKRYSSSLGDTHPSLKLPSFYVCRTSTGPLLGSSQIS